MDITYLAETCFRLRSKERTVLVGPTAAVMTQEADLGLLAHPGMEVPPKLRLTYPALDAPGEFEYGGVLLYSFGNFIGEAGPNAERNLIWLVEMDGVTVCHLGLLAHTLSASEIDALGSPDVLLVPVGAKASLKADQVADLIGHFDGLRYVVPYTPEASDEAALKRAANKIGSDLDMPVDDLKPKLSLNRSSSSSGSASFVVLEPKK